VKPNTLYEGRGVVRASDPRQVAAGLRQALELDEFALVQPFAHGLDVRAVVFDGEVVAAYVRTAPTIFGDGQQDLSGLVVNYMLNADVGLRLRIGSVSEIEQRLRQRFGKLDHVLDVGEVMALTDAANFAAGRA